MPPKLKNYNFAYINYQRLLKGEINMRGLKYASVRYCSLLERNVVFENYYGEDGERKCECLNKSLCGYETSGCRNRLYNQRFNKAAGSASVQTENIG